MASKSPFVKPSPRYSDCRTGMVDNERKRLQDEPATSPKRRKQERLSSSGDSYLCSGCRAIDFSSILRQHTLSSNGRSAGYEAASLSHFDPSKSTECALCTFLTNLVSTRASTHPTKMRGGYRLVAYSATKRLIPRAIKQIGHTDIPLLAILPSLGRIPGWSRTDTPTMFCSIQTPADQSHSPGLSEHQFSVRPIESKVDCRIAREWLDQCFLTHTNICERKISPPMALRVIDCREEGHLQLTDLSCSSNKYVALSYVWGKISDEGVTAPHSLENPPLVVRDAAAVVRALGFNYLWVDRYCISQDNPQEKHRLLQNMGHIYSGSVLTVIAAAGEGPDLGLPGVSVSLRTQPRVQTKSYALNLLDMRGASVVENSCWNTRAWTYQERVFPARKLYFTSSGMYFQCQGLTCTESISCPLKLVDSALITKKKSAYGLYSSLPTLFSNDFSNLWEYYSFEYHVNKYHRRKLSFESDALNAFKGILQLQRELWGTLHLCGVPILDTIDNQLSLKSFLLGLSWTCDRVEAGELRPGFPSWSWTGWRTHKCLGFHCSVFRRYSYKVVTDTSISVQFPELSGSTILQWTAEREDILQMASISHGPPLLHIRAWSFELEKGSIEVDHRFSPDSQMFKWKVKGHAKVYSGFFYMNEGAGALVGGLQREEILKLIALLEGTDSVSVQTSTFMELLAVRMRADESHYRRVGRVHISHRSHHEFIQATGATLQEIILG